MPKLVFSKDKIESTYKIVDEGLYTVEITGFKPKKSKSSDSVNLNPQMEIVALGDGSPAPKKEDGKNIPVFYNLNTSADFAMNDFCHCFGLPMEDCGGGNMTIPGTFDGPDGVENADKWVYKGPLLHRKGVVMLVKDTYNGKENNKVKYFVCAIKDCHQKYPKVKHSTDLTKSK